MYYQFPQSSLSSIKPAYDGKQSITFSDNNQSNSQATEMNHQWQTTVLNILDEQRVSLFDLLQFILRTHLPIHSHHRDALQYHTSNIMDLWSEQYPAETQQWAQRAAREMYRNEVIKLIQPHAAV